MSVVATDPEPVHIGIFGSAHVRHVPTAIVANLRDSLPSIPFSAAMALSGCLIVWLRAAAGTAAVSSSPVKPSPPPLACVFAFDLQVC